MTGITLEVCVDQIASLHAAVAGRADRIELCSALELGGLTPTAGLIGAAAKCDIPVFAMIRPRSGNFDYSPDELDLMIDDISMCADAGLAGVVFGAARSGALETTILERLVTAAGKLGTTLHRAFDTLADPLPAIEIAAELGFERILTSGGARTAEDGVSNIRKFVERADDNLSIMAGSGIGPGNVAKIIHLTGVREVHGSFSGKSPPHDPAIKQFGFAVHDRRTTADAVTIEQVRQRLTKSPPC